VVVASGESVIASVGGSPKGVLREVVLFVVGWHPSKKTEKIKRKRDERLKVIP